VALRALRQNFASQDLPDNRHAVKRALVVGIVSAQGHVVTRIGARQVLGSQVCAFGTSFETDSDRWRRETFMFDRDPGLPDSCVTIACARNSARDTVARSNGSSFDCKAGPSGFRPTGKISLLSGELILLHAAAGVGPKAKALTRASVATDV